MDYQTIIFAKTPDMVGTITINRPEQMNSFNRTMCEEFRHVWESIRVDDEVRSVVLRAAPGRAFCTGVDVRNPSNVNIYDDIFSKIDPGVYLGPKQNKLWKPVVCAVHGMAAGGAFYWINESDIVICSDDATFFDPHVTYGMVAALEPIGARYIMPLQQVLRMTLLGNDERISAQTALNISLVTEVTSRDALWGRAHELAAKIAAKPPAAIQGSVRAIWESLDASRSHSLGNGMHYCLVGNPIGVSQVDRNDVMAKAKIFDVR